MPNPDGIWEVGRNKIEWQQMVDRMGLDRVPEVTAEEPDNGVRKVLGLIEAIGGG